MTTKVLATAAAVTLLSATAASAACNWGSKNYTAQTTVDMKQVQTQVAQAPVDAWLIKYLEEWEQA